MRIIKTTPLTTHQSSQINQLWNDEYPLKLKDRFPILLDGADWHNHYIILDEEQNVIAWAVDFEKEKQIRFPIIVASNHKGKGLGGLLIDKLKEENKEFYGWVIDHNDDLKSNGEHYQTPMPFYLKHGFEILNDIRIDNEMIKAVLIKWIENNNS
jgi:GNAT superfamily N-acetyltransferase